MDFVYDIQFKYTDKCAGNLLPNILTYAPVCKHVATLLSVYYHQAESVSCCLCSGAG